MKDLSGYLRIRTVTATAAAVGLMAIGSLGVLADGETFDGGGKVGKDDGYAEYSFAAPSYAIPVGDTVYQYATGEDGNAYYATYDGGEWSTWQGWDAQPAPVKWDPAPVAYNDAAYVSYISEDGAYYFGSGDEWSDISGGYEFTAAPYLNVYGDRLYAYGTASDGYVYWKDFDGQTWGEWGKISDDYASAYEVYAVDWDGYNNVFWTAPDGTVYWNRFDGTDWTGSKALPGDYQIGDAVYATGYDGNLYAFGSTNDWAGAYNVFTPGDGWSGWATFDGAPEVYYQPAAYTYQDQVHVVYSGKDGHGYYRAFQGGEWTDWQDLGENYAYEPALYEYADGYYLTYTGENGSVYYKTWEAGKDKDGY